MRRRSEGVLIGGEATAAPLPYPAEEIIAALEPLATEARAARVQGVLSRRLASVTVVVDSLHDPHNGAAIVRSCDAFGVQYFHAIERHEPFAAARAVARGSQKWVDVVRHPGPAACIAALRASGHELIATHPEGELVPEDLARIPKVALVLGNERDGIMPDVRAACTRAVRVPMSGFVESLNVSVTTAILLFAATRGREGDLDEATRRTLYARGLWQTVPRAHEHVEAVRVHAQRG
ncbi:MAG: RNA methyltransferase [Deltaproteobacteria bacterium]|nr:RNA methyltransferase [Deltaproteobacteria bacterium]